LLVAVKADIIAECPDVVLFKIKFCWF
jgi:hypothetical protein